MGVVEHNLHERTGRYYQVHRPTPADYERLVDGIAACIDCNADVRRGGRKTVDPDRDRTGDAAGQARGADDDRALPAGDRQQRIAVLAELEFNVVGRSVYQVGIVLRCDDLDDKVTAERLGGDFKSYPGPAEADEPCGRVRRVDLEREGAGEQNIVDRRGDRRVEVRRHALGGKRDAAVAQSRGDQAVAEIRRGARDVELDTVARQGLGLLEYEIACDRLPEQIEADTRGAGADERLVRAEVDLHVKVRIERNPGQKDRGAAVDRPVEPRGLDGQCSGVDIHTQHVGDPVAESQ